MTPSLTEATQDGSPLEPRGVLLVLLCAIVLLFRAAAWRNPSSFIVIPDSLALPLGGLGVLFLVCGVWAWLSNPSPLTRVFLAYGMGAGVHWGGTIASHNPGAEMAFLAFYMAVTAIGDGAFLDLSLRYPHRQRRWGRRALAFYLLGILTFLTVPIAPFLPREIVKNGLGFVLVVAFAMSIAAGLVFIVKWFRATRAERREHLLTPIVGALIVTSVLDLLADEGMLPGPPEAWTLIRTRRATVTSPDTT